MIKISVIICTYNNAKCLKQAILSLIDQTLDKNLYEILVVDNNSSDETVLQVKSFQLKSLAEIRLIRETEQGLGYARNKGLRSAKGEYVAFIDDDAKADEYWLENAIKITEDSKLKPIAVGGVILPFYIERKPDWFKDEYETRSWGEKERFLEGHETLSGSNMIIRKVEAIKYGGFENKVGMKGSYLSVGEETSLFEKIREKIKEDNIFYYSPKLIVYHQVATYKMTVIYQLKRSFAAGYAKFLRFGQLNLVKRFVYQVFYFIVIFFSILLAFLLFFKYRRYQNWLVEQFSPVLYLLGFESGLLGFSVSLKRR